MDSIQEAIEAISKGEMIVVMDDEHRENEGDIIMAASHITTEKMAFILRHSTGIICTPMSISHATALELPLMVQNNTDPKKTAFTVSVDALGNTTTGVSAKDRATTVKALSSLQSKPTDFNRPGHIFPLIAHKNGLQSRRGHTEASVLLCELAQVQPPVAVISELIDDDGNMMRLNDCKNFAKTHNLKIITIEALAKFCGINETVVEPEKLLDSSEIRLLAECKIPISREGRNLGDWAVRCYGDKHFCRHIALIKGDISEHEEPLLVRVHSECFTSEVLGSMKCDCKEQLDAAFIKIHAKGKGVILYVDGHEGRGIGLPHKLKAYELQRLKGIDTFVANEELGLPKDARKYDTPKAILRELKVSNIEIMTNNPHKIEAFREFINSSSPLTIPATEFNKSYLEAKEKAYGSPELKPTNKPSSNIPIINTTITATTNATIVQNTTNTTPQNSSQVRSAVVSLPSDGDKGHSSTFHKTVPIALPTPSNVASLKIAIIRTCWNEELVGSLSSQTRQELLRFGAKEENIGEDIFVPGSYELPYVAQSLAESGEVDAVIAIGVLIKGETMHFEFISQAVAQGLMQVQLNSRVPVIYSVLNCLTLAQAEDRCGTKSPLPSSLAASAIRMAYLKTTSKPRVTVSQTYSLLAPCTGN
eukprot:TRINITY_DN215_c0_g1_i1.p1 TRINITY_DN215_c0_g1~~TRINITY_DN215_c0_g1_i1.p1  ORF type:complete len:648 (+),score=150.74 TRINITY_DN215_c0_g1_i1:241-2184(+)